MQMRGVRWLFAAVIVGTTALAVLPAVAQISPFRSSFAAGLTDQDFKMIQQATTSQLTPDPLADGTREDWRNPATGMHGSVASARTFRRAGHECHVVDYTAMRRSGRNATRQTLNWCKTQAGWKIL
jgi:surface antigen